MDFHSTINAVISDKESFEEFVESFRDLAPRVERAISQLKGGNNDRDLFEQLFRSIHSIKGDAALCKVEAVVSITHPIESLLVRFRTGEIVFSDILAETILLALDRLELAIEALATGNSLNGLQLEALIQGFDRLAQVPASILDKEAGELVEQVTGFRPVSESTQKLLRNIPLTFYSSSKSKSNAAEDLSFFHVLAQQFEARSPLFKGRTTRLLRLAEETNAELGSPIDPVQLEAAVYMHDVGMMFLPESIWLKVERMTDEDKRTLRSHPAYAYNILKRIGGWDEAAEMVRQHHEMPDGRGYPEGLHSDDICPGAKILAIVDAFESIMLKHANRGRNRSVLRAIAEINACDNQFSPEWIEPFNRIIRRGVES